MNYQEQQKFSALQTAATVFMALGGLIIAVSLFFGIAGLAEMNDAYGTPGLTIIMYLSTGLIGSLGGVLFIGIGQLLRCFIGVYENTFEAKQLLKAQNEQLLTKAEASPTGRSV